MGLKRVQGIWGDWGVNADLPSAAAAIVADLPSVATATGAWAEIACPGIAKVPMLYAFGANNATGYAAVCPN